MIKIYLSPSNQPANAYCVGKTNEKAEMEALAHKIKAILDSDYNCQTIMATLSMGIGLNERPKEAKDKGCSVYIAIHSNASNGTASGAVCFYHPNQVVGNTLATSIVKELNAVCPVKSNRSAPVANGMNAFDGTGYGEIRSPYQHDMVAVLVETDFHDNPVTAQWIIDSKDTIARAYVKAITETLGISKKSTAPTATGKFYRVQVGAYSVKSNADAMLEKLRKSGFEGAFVKYD